MSQTATPEATAPTVVQKIGAEALGTFVLVLLGCGSLAFADAAESLTTVTTVGLTFGLALAVMVYAVGRISGGHFNPAVTVGAALGGRIAWREVGLYIGAQLAGAILAGLALLVLLQGYEGFEAEDSLGRNGFGDDFTGYAWWAAFLLELLLTALFVYVVLGVTDSRNQHPALAPLAVGLALAAFYFVAIPATGASLNPARSIGPGLFAGSEAIKDLWLFIVAPLLGAALAGLTYPLLFGRADRPVPGSGLNLPKRAKAGAAPGYGAPDAYQQQWNQNDPYAQQYGAPQGGGYPQQGQGYQQQYQGEQAWAPQGEQQAGYAQQSWEQQPGQHAGQPGSWEPQAPQQWQPQQPPQDPQGQRTAAWEPAPPQAPQPQQWEQPQPPAQGEGQVQPGPDDEGDARTQIRPPQH